MNKEKEFHKKIQELRNEYALYLKEIKINDFYLSHRATQINNEFVKLLMLNEIIHKEKKEVSKWKHKKKLGLVFGKITHNLKKIIERQKGKTIIIQIFVVVLLIMLIT